MTDHICFFCRAAQGERREGVIWLCESCAHDRLGIEPYTGGDAYDRARDERERERETE
jgi:ribosomal protein L37AE/L43A